MITDVLDSDGEAVASSAEGVSYLHHDVTQESEWESVIAEVLEDHGKIDAFIMNAGIYRHAPITETAIEEYRLVIEINQVGVFLGLKHVGQVMARGGVGCNREHLLDRGDARRRRVDLVHRQQMGGAGDDEGGDVRVCALRRAGELDPSRTDRHADAAGATGR